MGIGRVRVGGELRSWEVKEKIKREGKDNREGRGRGGG